MTPLARDRRWHEVQSDLALLCESHTDLSVNPCCATNWLCDLGLLT